MGVTEALSGFGDGGRWGVWEAFSLLLFPEEISAKAIYLIRPHVVQPWS